MGWPKGMPRKGHVNADGTPHKAKGDNLRNVVLDVRRVPVGVDPFVKTTHKRPAVVVFPSTEGTVNEDKHWGYKGNHPVTEKCPNCFYVYAEGGYCPECHWSAPVNKQAWDSNRGRVR